MSKKLFVGGLAWATTDATFLAAFEPFGEIVEAKVICDHQTGRSRGFGFVTYADENCAKTACETMNEQQIDGRTVRVSFADQSSRAKSNDRPRKHNAPNDSRPPRERREYKSEHPKFQPSDFPQDIPQNRRDNRKKDRKSDRDRYEDEERW